MEWTYRDSEAVIECSKGHVGEHPMFPDTPNRPLRSQYLCDLSSVLGVELDPGPQAWRGCVVWMLLALILHFAEPRPKCCMSRQRQEDPQGSLAGLEFDKRTGDNSGTQDGNPQANEWNHALAKERCAVTRAYSDRRRRHRWRSRRHATKKWMKTKGCQSQGLFYIRKDPESVGNKATWKFIMLEDQ